MVMAIHRAESRRSSPGTQARNSKTPLDHLAEYVRVTTDEDEPRWWWDSNERWSGTDALRAHVERVVQMSVESARVIGAINADSRGELQ